MKKTDTGKLIIAGNIVMIAIGLLVYIITQRTEHFMMDDIWYSTRLFDDTPITSLKDILDAQIWHYHNWGGRSVTHTILQLTLLAGETVSDILNVLVTVLLAFLVAMVSGNRRISYIIAAAMLMISCNANWRMSMFWQSGAANYLYITCFILLFVYLYLRRIPDEGEEWMQKKDPFGIAVYIVPLGLMAGWSNENMGPAAWIISTCVMIMLVINKIKLRPWMVLGNLSALAGSVLVVAAPGNFVRSAEAVKGDYGTLWKIYLRCYAEGKAAFEFLFPILIVLVAVLAVCKIMQIRIGVRNLLILAMAILSWGAMFLSPHYPDRATFGTLCLIICVVLSLVGKIIQKKEEAAFPLWCCICFFWFRSMYVLAEYLGVIWGWIK